jgi:hypothetical protein
MYLIGGEMIKKFFIPVAFFTLILFMTSCGGSGGGSSSTSRGVNPGIPSVVKLTDVQNIVQTNSSAFFKARILDGNGTPVPNEPVTFTNLSPIGTLNAVNAVTVANTDDLGFATATVFSAESGFVTVQAEVNSGAGQVRDRRTVFFASVNTGSGLFLFPFMILDVDGDGDGIFNEPNDFILLQDATDNEVIVRATVFDRFGLPEALSTVLFAADVPYRVGTDTSCSDGSDSCEVVFPGGVQKITNSLGQAFVRVRFEPGSLRSVQTLFNVLAQANVNGLTVFNIVTLFVDPIFISSVILSADPSIVETDGSSTISADVITNLNTPPPDGTTVNFRTTICGSVEPFGQTTDGRAEVEFTAPSTEGTCTVTGSVGGVSGSVSVRVTTELTINPSTIGVDGSTGAVLPFTISGGIGPYTTTSSDPTIACNDAGEDAFNDCNDPLDSSIWTGSNITVTVPAGTPPGSVTLNVQDSDGNTVSATITINGGAGLLTILPANQTISIAAIPVGIGVALPAFNITGGTPPYTTTHFSALTQACNDVAPLLDDCVSAGDSATWSGTPVIVTIPSTAVSGLVTLIVNDSAAGVAFATVTINP